MEDTTLLGFDIRCDNSREWDAKRRNAFLFRTDCHTALFD